MSVIGKFQSYEFEPAVLRRITKQKEIRSKNSAYILLCDVVAFIYLENS